LRDPDLSIRIGSYNPVFTAVPLARGYHPSDKLCGRLFCFAPNTTTTVTHFVENFDFHFEEFFKEFFEDLGFLVGFYIKTK
jgi:hypothetical protein